MQKTTRSDSLVQKSPIKTEIRVDIGNVMPTNAFVKAQNQDADGLAHYTSYSLRLAKQTTGAIYGSNYTDFLFMELDSIPHSLKIPQN